MTAPARVEPHVLVIAGLLFWLLLLVAWQHDAQCKRDAGTDAAAVANCDRLNS